MVGLKQGCKYAFSGLSVYALEVLALNGEELALSTELKSPLSWDYPTNLIFFFLSSLFSFCLNASLLTSFVKDSYLCTLTEGNNTNIINA